MKQGAMSGVGIATRFQLDRVGLVVGKAVLGAESFGIDAGFGAWLGVDVVGDVVGVDFWCDWHRFLAGWLLFH